MRGARRAVLIVAAGAALSLGTVGTARATAPPSSPPGSGAPPTSVPTTGAPGTADEATPTATTIVVPPEATLPRAGAAIDDLDRRADDETWSVRRLVTATLLGIAALAIAGYVYGRLQSVAPRVGRTIARPLR